MSNIDDYTSDAPGFGVLSVLEVLTGNLRLLILVPVIAGAVVYLLAMLIPPVYESRSVLRFPQQAMVSGSGSSGGTNLTGYTLSSEAMMAAINSSDVLLPLLPLAPWVQSDGSDSEALTKMRRQVVANINRRDGMLSIVTYAPSPQQAKELHGALLERLRSLMKPRGNVLSGIEKRKALALATLAELDKVLPVLSKQAVVAAESEAGKAASTYGLLLEHRQATSETLHNLESSLDAFGSEVFVQSPTLPDRPSSPDKVFLAIIGAVASLFVVVFWMFFNHALKRIEGNPEHARQLKAIRNNIKTGFGISRSPDA